MYLRLTQRRNRDGSVVRYVQLAHNRRVNGRARAEVVANLGREDQLDVTALRRLVASIGRYLDKVEPDVRPDSGGGPAVEPPAPSGQHGGERPAGFGGPQPTTAHPPGLAPLPTWADRLVGRDVALADLPVLLSRHPLVTITGPAGVGKTRLAAEFVHRAKARYRRGVWWADLAPLPPGSPVDSAVAAMVGATGEPGSGLREIIAASCAAASTLLVLDNCEHVMDGCAELVTWLLAACPKLRLLATSREGLRIPGEALYPLQPLAVPVEPAADGPVRAADDVREVESVRLFLDRARAASPGFELTDAHATLAGRLCARLDGLPLAIELTARQLTTLTLAQVVERMDDRLVLLTGGSRVVPQRHRSLRAAIGWSYELLDPLERAVFRRLCAMPGGFDEAGAAAICADLDLGHTELWPLLRTLVDKSMLVPDSSAAPAVRFRILESLRAFGVDQLHHEGEAADARERLLAWLTELARPLITDVTASAVVVRLNSERHNLNHAVHLPDSASDPRYPLLVVALAFVVRSQGQIQHSRQLLDRVLARDREPTPARAAALLSLAMIENWAGNHEAARRYAEESLHLAGHLGNRALQHRARQRLAMTLCNLGDYPAAIALANRTVATLRAGGNDKALAIALNDLAWLLMQQGDLAAAARAAGEALSSLSAEDKSIWDTAMHTAGAIAFKQGRIDQAAACFSLALATGVSFTAQVPYNLEGLALTAAASGRPRRALRLFAAASTARSAAGRAAGPWWAQLCDNTITVARDQLTTARAAAATADGTRLGTDDAIRYALLDRRPPAKQANGSPLTSREQQVAQLVADGLTNSQIAARLGVSSRTVVSHLEHIRAKLDLSTRTQIAAWTSRQ
jgi:predicted ATPase/DNA-binding CsgD family transcriptional regulator